MSGDERRAMIIAAAREVFSRHGYHGASTAEIAAAAQCSEAVLYRHFDSKQDILLAVYDTLQTVVDGIMGGEAAVRGGPDDALVALVARAGSDPELTRAMRNFVLALSMSHEPEVAERLLDNYAWIRGRLAELVRAAQDAGSVRADVDPELVVWLWHGLVVTAAVRNGVRADGFAAQAEDAGRMLASLLAPPAAGG